MMLRRWAAGRRLAAFATTTTPLAAPVRHQSDSRRSSSVNYVSTRSPELEGDLRGRAADALPSRADAVAKHLMRPDTLAAPPSGRSASDYHGLNSVATRQGDVGAAADNTEDGGAATDAAASGAEPTEVDFTAVEKLSQLERRYCRTAAEVTFLSAPERQLFSRMIYDKFYKDPGQTSVDPALLYQASLEIQWVEEWVAGRASAAKWGADEARRHVKRALLERVDLHKPLSYIIGSQPFYGCDIHCEVPLLCPRPETEMWTHWMVHHHLGRAAANGAAGTTADGAEAPSLRILDVCCGTGCIGVALAKHLPCAAVTALDILPAAVRVSQDNARRNGIPPARYTAVQSDMFACFSEAPSATTATTATTAERPISAVKEAHVGTFDVIVSNPPYVLPAQYVELPPTITHWESKTALVGDDYRESRQYLYFKELCVHGARLLKPRRQRHAMLRDAPNIAIEVGLQAHMVAELMDRSKLWHDVEVHLDYAQQERWITANSAH